MKTKTHEFYGSPISLDALNKCGRWDLKGLFVIDQKNDNLFCTSPFAKEPRALKIHNCSCRRPFYLEKHKIGLEKLNFCELPGKKILIITTSRLTLELTLAACGVPPVFFFRRDSEYSVT